MPHLVAYLWQCAFSSDSEAMARWHSARAIRDLEAPGAPRDNAMHSKWMTSIVVEETFQVRLLAFFKTKWDRMVGVNKYSYLVCGHFIIDKNCDSYNTRHDKCNKSFFFVAIAAVLSCQTFFLCTSGRYNYLKVFNDAFSQRICSYSCWHFF